MADRHKQHINAEHERQNPEQEQHSPPDIAGIRNAIESIAESQKTAHSHKQWYKDRTFWVSLVGLAVVIGYTAVTFDMWRDANHNFVVNHRAWVGVSRPISITKITNGPQDSTITYVVTVKNYGPSVARRVWIVSKVTTSLTEIGPDINQSCEEASRGTGGTAYIGDLTKPGETLTQITGETIFPSDEPGQWFRDISFKRGGSVFVVGCVSYRDEFDNPRHTKFCNWTQEDLTKANTPIFLYSFFGANDAD